MAIQKRSKASQWKYLGDEERLERTTYFSLFTIIPPFHHPTPDFTTIANSTRVERHKITHVIKMISRRRGPLASATFLATSTLTVIIGLSLCGNTYALLSSLGTICDTQRPSAALSSIRTLTTKATTCSHDNVIIVHNKGFPGQQYYHHTTSSLYVTSNHADDNDNDGIIDAPQTTTPLCDLQTFLRLCNLVDSGGAAKTAIQNSQCLLNDNIETRRSKKLFPGDTVTFGNVAKNLDVETEVKKKGYIYKPKVKKVKPLPKVDAGGNLEFGGRHRSEEWRAERKLKKAERKAQNKQSK